MLLNTMYLTSPYHQITSSIHSHLWLGGSREQNLPVLSGRKLWNILSPLSSTAALTDHGHLWAHAYGTDRIVLLFVMQPPALHVQQLKKIAGLPSLVISCKRTGELLNGNCQSVSQFIYCLCHKTQSQGRWSRFQLTKQGSKRGAPWAVICE